AAGYTIPETFPSMKFVLPTSRRGRCTMLKRNKVNAWFNQATFDDVYQRKEIQLDGLVESTTYIRQLVQEEIGEIGAGNVFLGGISQGCATALHTLLTLEVTPEQGREKQRIAGFLGLAGYLPFAKDILKAGRTLAPGEEDDPVECNGNAPTTNGGRAAKLVDRTAYKSLVSVRETHSLPLLSGLPSSLLETPFLITHGDQDDKIALKFARDAVETLRVMGCSVMFRVYRGLGHWYKAPEGIDDVIKFLEKESGIQAALVAKEVDVQTDAEKEEREEKEMMAPASPSSHVC